jgi:TrmH family RNA methyltransferase
VTRITSRQHALVRRCRALAAGPEAGNVLLAGEHLIADALDAGIRIDALITSGGHPALVTRARQSGTDIYEGTASVLDAASPVRTTSGIVAIATWAPRSIAEIFKASEGRPLHTTMIGLVDIQDPGNVGAAIRSADALGGAPVLALGATADPGGWKALRGAMGSTFRVLVARGDVADAVRMARARGIRIAATVPAAGDSIATVDWHRPTLALLGNEGAGLPDAIAGDADLRITIPMRRDANSLNVAATAAILLHEAHRSRAD